MTTISICVTDIAKQIYLFSEYSFTPRRSNLSKTWRRIYLYDENNASLCDFLLLQWQMEMYDIDIFSIFLRASMIWKTNKWGRPETLQQDATRTGTHMTYEGYSTRHE